VLSTLHMAVGQTATVVVSHREELIKIRKGTALSVRSLVNPGPMTCGLAAIQTNKQTFFFESFMRLTFNGCLLLQRSKICIKKFNVRQFVFYLLSPLHYFECFNVYEIVDAVLNYGCFTDIVSTNC
jgi:hypothetical protein